MPLCHPFVSETQRVHRHVLWGCGAAPASGACGVCLPRKPEKPGSRVLPPWPVNAASERGEGAWRRHTPSLTVPAWEGTPFFCSHCVGENVSVWPPPQPQGELGNGGPTWPARVRMGPPFRVRSMSLGAEFAAAAAVHHTCFPKHDLLHLTSPSGLP